MCAPDRKGTCWLKNKKNVLLSSVGQRSVGLSSVGLTGQEGDLLAEEQPAHAAAPSQPRLREGLPREAETRADERAERGAVRVRGAEGRWEQRDQVQRRHDAELRSRRGVRRDGKVRRIGG